LFTKSLLLRRNGVDISKYKTTIHRKLSYMEVPK